MNLSAPLRKEMHELCSAYLLERMTIEQAARLENVVINNPNACQFFVESMSLDAHLQWGAIPSVEGFRFISDQSEPLSQKEVEAASRRIAKLPRTTIWVKTKRKLLRNRSLFALTGGLLLLFVLLMITFLWSSPEDETLADSHHAVWSKETLPIEKNGKIEAVAKNVAVVKTISEGELRSHDTLFVANDLLETGRQFHLEKGLLELKMNSGTEILLAGPTTFQLLDSNRLRLLRGTLLAEVPHQAIGFEVKTPSGSIVDLGTVFGVEVDLSGTSGVQVFQGEVQVASSSGIKKRLSVGSAMHCNAEKKEWEPSEKLSTKFYTALETFDRTPKSSIAFIHSDGDRILGADKYGKISYIMYSATPVEKRFAAFLTTPWGGNSQHFMAVHFDEATQKWLLQENQTLHEFQPVSTDLIIAKTEPLEKKEGGVWSRKVTLFENHSDNIHGIPSGYETGDITIRPDWLAGKSNTGEFTLKGTYFIRPTK